MSKTRTIKIQSTFQKRKFKDHVKYPSLLLKGKWLRNLNFNIGDRVTIEETDNKIVITKN